jgi:hypothetical protein
MHQLQLHEVLLQVCHCVAELCEAILQTFERVAGSGGSAATL